MHECETLNVLHCFSIARHFRGGIKTCGTMALCSEQCTLGYESMLVYTWALHTTITCTMPMNRESVMLGLKLATSNKGLHTQFIRVLTVWPARTSTTQAGPVYNSIKRV